MLKKSTVAVSSCKNLHGFCYSTPGSPTSSHPSKQTSARPKPLTRFRRRQCRPYAMVAEGYSTNKHEHLPWPEVTTANAIPTPYQIFNQRKESPYSKRTFYELVKLYHPDRHNCDGIPDGISFSTKLERYRLVVAANDILSDPIKRSAYDCYGAGWNGQPEVKRAWDASDSAGNWDYYPEGNWGGRGSPFQNATWEDWEKWYDREKKKEQKPNYLSNGAFVGLIVICAALGGIGQATRVGNYSMNFTEQRNALHDEISKDLVRRRKESNEYGDRNERVHSFLKQRDPFGYGLIDPEEEGYRKLLPTPEVCSSDDIQGRSMDIYDTKTDKKDS